MSVTFVVVSVVLLCFRPIFPFSSFLPFLFIGGFDSNALCRSRRELSNAYLLEKFGFDTAESELSKVCRSKQAIPTPGQKSGSGFPFRTSGCDGRVRSHLRFRLGLGWTEALALGDDERDELLELFPGLFI